MFEDGEGQVRATVSAGQEDIEGKYDNHTVSFDEKVRNTDRVMSTDPAFPIRFCLTDQFSELIRQSSTTLISKEMDFSSNLQFTRL